MLLDMFPLSLYISIYSYGVHICMMCIYTFICMYIYTEKSYTYKIIINPHLEEFDLSL